MSPAHYAYAALATLGGLCMAFASGIRNDAPLLLLATALLAAAIALGIRLRLSARTVLITGLLLRLCAMPQEASDDLNRYVWEGWVTLHGFNPYEVPPNDPRLDALDLPLRAGINHPDITAIYPPGILLFFSALSALAPSLVLFKAAVILFDLLTLLLLLDLLKHLGRHPAWALLYAAHPLVLVSFAAEAHLDAFAVYFLTQAAWCHVRQKPLAAFISLTLGIHAKYIALLALPFFVNRHTWRRLWVVPIIGTLPLLPFRLSEHLFAAFVSFNGIKHYNGSLHNLAHQVLGDPTTASLTCAGLLLGVLIVLRLCNGHALEGPGFALLALLLFSPNVHFWYATWLFPWVVLLPLRASVVLSFSTAVCFLTYREYAATGVWREHSLLLWLEYLPVYLALAFSFRRIARLPAMNDAHPRSPLHTVSVITPVYREPIETLRPVPGAMETVLAFADGEEVPPLPDGLRAVSAPRGRGHQIAAAARVCRGDVLVIRHADTALPAEVLPRMTAILNRTGRVGGAVGTRFPSPTPLMRLVTRLNRLRAGWAGLAFGDQVQFVRRDWLEEQGGFPGQALMEDVELSCRLKEQGLPLFLDGDLAVAGRSWRRGEALRRFFLVLHLTGHYLLCRFFSRHTPDTTRLFQRYYG